MNNSRKGNTMKDMENARHMENLRVITKMVRIEDSEFVLISFDAQTENMKEFYGERVFGLIDYKHLDENGCLNKPLMNGEMAISSTPAEAIERKRKDLLCRRWRAEHPDATEQEFMQYVLTVYAA